MNGYEKQANDFLKETGTTFEVEQLARGKYFPNDAEERDIYKITLIREDDFYSFKFGQSIANRGVEPTPYDVLACLTTCNPESFDDFCDNYGYDNDSISAFKTYKAVVKEYKKVYNLYNADELKRLSEIS